MKSDTEGSVTEENGDNLPTLQVPHLWFMFIVLFQLGSHAMTYSECTKILYDQHMEDLSQHKVTKQTSEFLSQFYLLKRDKPGAVGGTNTWPSMLYWLVGDGELSQVVSNHLRL